jgi:hypothetical protein
MDTWMDAVILDLGESVRLIQATPNRFTKRVSTSSPRSERNRGSYILPSPDSSPWNARDEAYVRDVLGTMSAANNILVLNDEAHHACPKMIQSGLDASEGLAMRTTILAYAIAIVGFAMIVAGTWDVYLLYNEQTF